MKKYIVIFMFAAIMLIVLGCGNNEAGNAVGEKDGKKELNLAMFSLGANIEPTESWNGWDLSRLGVGENLVQLDENMNFKGVIAEDWETIDETTTVFKIREGVKFHNGKPVDAQAVKESIERALDISNRDDVKFPVESIEAEGNTLTIITTQPYATLINNLADPVYIIVDTQAAKEEGFKYRPIATGPFKVTDFIPDVAMTVEKHGEYWSGDVAIDIVNVKNIPDATVRAMALQSGEIDIATQINARDLSLFENNEKFKVLKGPNLRVFLLRFNMDKPYMQDIAFRKALAYGIDKEVYTRELVNGVPAKGPFNDMLSFGYTGEDLYQYNPEKAKQLLDGAGIVDTNGDGIREVNGQNIVLKFIASTNHGSDARNIGTAIQSQLKDIGIGVEVIQIENISQLTDSGDYDLRWERWTSAPTADPQYFLEASFKINGSGNVGNYSNQRVEEIIAKLDGTLDKKTRDELGIAATEILMEDLPAIFLYYGEGNVVTNKKVAGVYRFVSEVYYIDERVKSNDN